MTVDTAAMTRRLFWGLLAAEVLLVLLDAVITYGQLVEDRYIRRLFNITREDSIPNWFSSMQFLLISLAAWWAFFVHRCRFSPRWQLLGWWLVAAGFLFLSLDDGSRLHERVGAWVAESYSQTDTVAGSLVDANPSYTWHLVMGPFFALGGLFVLGFVMTQLNSVRQRLLFVAGVGCFIVSQGMDFLEGIDAVVEQVRAALDVDTYDVTHFAKSAEEFIEMLGQSLILVVFVRHLGCIGAEMFLRQSADERPVTP
ncbi:hypothetical protein [Motiliproteus sediminis]|uniref:hypothetical protein n=1 Tax=Motiliproteus sediminis TaxID=1468178 RepID=UPI001AEF6A10|nr:hypothetical protein [Motiliproteus sediminis]